MRSRVGRVLAVVIAVIAVFPVDVVAGDPGAQGAVRAPGRCLPQGLADPELALRDVETLQRHALLASCVYDFIIRCS